MTADEILETYALRWGIEVYFKEIKQHFGFLKEQSGDYAVHYASIHLCAIRFMLVAHGMLVSGEFFGSIRNKLTRQLEILTFARLLWELFKALIYGALDELKQIISESTIELIKQKITIDIKPPIDFWINCTYNKIMVYEWDENKRIQNLQQHGIDFYSVYEFDWDTSITIEDDRFEYHETRYISFGFIENRLHVLVHTARQSSVRVISFRRANTREISDYEKENQNN